MVQCSVRRKHPFLDRLVRELLRKLQDPKKAALTLVSLSGITQGMNKCVPWNNCWTGLNISSTWKKRWTPSSTTWSALMPIMVALRGRIPTGEKMNLVEECTIGMISKLFWMRKRFIKNVPTRSSKREGSENPFSLEIHLECTRQNTTSTRGMAATSMIVSNCKMILRG